MFLVDRELRKAVLQVAEKTLPYVSVSGVTEPIGEHARKSRHTDSEGCVQHQLIVEHKLVNKEKNK